MDFLPDRSVVRLFRWDVTTQPLDAIDTLEPFHTVELEREAGRRRFRSSTRSPVPEQRWLAGGFAARGALSRETRRDVVGDRQIQSAEVDPRGHAIQGCTLAYGLTLTYFCNFRGLGSPPYKLPSPSTATNSAPFPATSRGSPHG